MGSPSIAHITPHAGDTAPLSSNHTAPVLGNNSLSLSRVIAPYSTLPGNDQNSSGASDIVHLLAQATVPTSGRSDENVVPEVYTSHKPTSNLTDERSSSFYEEVDQEEKPTRERRYYLDEETGQVYKKGDLLGEGSFGAVYSVVDSKGVNYALKTYKGNVMPIMYEVEMLRLAGENTNVIKFFGMMDDPEGMFALFELCLSRDLSDLLIKRKKITQSEARYFGKGIAAGLAYLHSKRLIHCDVKPENIFFTPNMVVKVGDLGLSENYDPDNLKKHRVGTVGFIAPEVLKEQAHTYKMDSFSFGVTMYIMLEGKEPELTKWEKNEIYPNRLNTKMSEARNMNGDAKNMIERLLCFEPKERLSLENFGRQKFFIKGYCPERLEEGEVFDGVPRFINGNKRKGELVEDRVNTKAKVDRYEDPYCDLSVLYRTTNSLEADL